MADTAKEVILRNRKLEEVYPVTGSEQVRRPDGTSVEGTFEALEKRNDLRELFVAAGAVYNKSTGYYELYADEGGLTDLTESDMMNVFLETMPVNQGDRMLLYGRKILKARTNLKPSYSGGAQAFNNLIITNIEVLNVGTILPTNLSGFCYDAQKLRCITGQINLAYYNVKSTSQIAFKPADKLEDVEIHNLHVDFHLDSCASLSVKSILTMITRCNATSPITVTLQPEAFARAVADTEIQAALAEHTQITLIQSTI